jgi:uncharacterized protein (TIGR03435 family)
VTTGILNHLWQSTAFAAVAALLAFSLRSNRASVRYWIWMAASLKFVLPFALLVGIGGRVPVPARAGPAIAAAPVVMAIEQAAQPFVLPAPQAAHAFPAILFILWAAGFIAAIVRWAVQWRRVRSAPQLEPGVFGIFRPALVLPEGIADRVTPEQLRAIVAHELCHIRRRDNLFAAIHMAVEAIFWFHPLIWWIGARLVEERERACDEEVLREGNDPETYAGSILEACKLYLESPLACVSGVMGADLKRRIERIMRDPVGGKLTPSRKLLLVIAAIAVVGAPLAIGLLHAQPAAFEVVSIKPTPPGVNGGMLRPLPGGGLTGTNVTMRLLVKVAYHLQDSQMSGGPPWMNSAPYDIEAKGGGGGGMELMRSKIQALLADRFQLKVHHETRELPVFALEPAKGGLKIQPAQRERAEGDGGYVFGPGRAVSRLAPLSEFASLLSAVVDRPVIDRTGAPGNFDFTLQWTPENYKQPADAGSRPANEPLPDPNGPSLFTALQEQLGLKLEATKGPVDVLVIDSAQKPSEN